VAAGGTSGSHSGVTATIKARKPWFLATIKYPEGHLVEMIIPAVSIDLAKETAQSRAARKNGTVERVEIYNTRKHLGIGCCTRKR